MYTLVFLSFAIGVINAAPGYPDYGFGHSDYVQAAPAPIYTQAVVKPIYEAQPIIHHAPIVKTIAPVAPVIKTYAAPVVKAYAPATSFASVTSYQVAHAAPVVKTFVAPQPIIKSYVAQPSYIHAQPSYISAPSYGHDFSYGHGFH